MSLIIAQTAAGRTLVLSILLDPLTLLLAQKDVTSSSVDPKLSTPLLLWYLENSFREVVNLN